MARDAATIPTAASLRLSLAAAAVLACTVLTPAASQAEGGYGPPPHAVRRCPPPLPACHAGAPGYGPSGIVRAYLPRNNALPLYNEPPPRFPGH